MKNKISGEAAAPANAVQQSSKKPGNRVKTTAPQTEPKSSLLPIDRKQRQRNRTLPTPKVLNLLIATLPEVYHVAEVVGKWVWVQFTESPAAEIRQQLSELGFHWNNARQSWQHPCGTQRDERATYDPRKRYGSYFAADVQPA